MQRYSNKCFYHPNLTSLPQTAFRFPVFSGSSANFQVLFIYRGIDYRSVHWPLAVLLTRFIIVYSIRSQSVTSLFLILFFALFNLKPDLTF